MTEIWNPNFFLQRDIVFFIFFLLALLNIIDVFVWQPIRDKTDSFLNTKDSWILAELFVGHFWM